jgi:hypothetical protein
VQHMSLGCVGVQVWSTKMVNRHGDDQVEMCHADGQRAVKDKREA